MRKKRATLVRERVGGRDNGVTYTVTNISRQIATRPLICGSWDSIVDSELADDVEEDPSSEPPQLGRDGMRKTAPSGGAAVVSPG